MARSVYRKYESLGKRRSVNSAVLASTLDKSEMGLIFWPPKRINGLVCCLMEYSVIANLLAIFVRLDKNLLLNMLTK